MKERLLDMWDAVYDWAVEKPIQATVAGGVSAALVVGGISAPFIVGGDDTDSDAPTGVYVQSNPTETTANIPTVEQKSPEYTGSNKIKKNAPSAAPGGNNTPAAPPRERRVAPPKPKADNVTQKEVRELKERRIPPPAPDKVEKAPDAVQHQLPRPVHGRQATPPPPPRDSKAEHIVNTIEIKGERYPVLPMGVTKDEQGHVTFAPPENVGQVGWYQDSAEPGTNQEGSILMSAHVNSAQQGSGVGAVFTNLKPGDVITIWNTQGKKTQWKVSKSYENKKDTWELPESANRATGKQSLVLVTCGGAYVGPPLYYQMNIFTEAEQM